MDVNGYFQIFNMEDGTYIKIFPPIENGQSVVFEDMIRYLGKLGRFDIDMFDLKQKMKENNEAFLYKVDDQTKPPVEESFTLSISPDVQKCICKFYPPSNDGRFMDMNEIIESLEKHGVKFGIDTSVIRQYIDNRIYGQEYVVANGKEPVQGEDGRIEYTFNTNQKLIPKVLEDGSVDFRNLDLINKVKAGDVLATLYKEKLGESGYTVLGKEIPPKSVTKVKFVYGRNIDLSEDGLNLISNINGHVTLVDKKLVVSNIMELENIDMSTGNIDYEGNVVVKGDIRGGFTITALGNIDAYGIVEGAILKAEGNVILRYGIQGGGKGIIEAGGNVVAKFIENSTVIAGGDLQSEAIIHSKVSAIGDINLIGKKGIIVGGVVRASKKITAKTIGTPMGVDTIIEVGADPKTIDRYHEVNKEIAKIKKEISQIVPTITLYQNKRAEGEYIRPEFLLRLQELTKLFREKKNKFDSLQEEYARIQDDFAESDAGCIIVQDIAYQGVKIMMSDAGLSLREERTHCKFCRVDAEIVSYNL